MVVDCCSQLSRLQENQLYACVCSMDSRHQSWRSLAAWSRRTVAHFNHARRRRCTSLRRGLSRVCRRFAQRWPSRILVLTQANACSSLIDPLSLACKNKKRKRKKKIKTKKLFHTNTKQTSNKTYIHITHTIKHTL